MGTEIFTFGPLEPEKLKFKDGNPTFKIMTEPNTFSIIVIQISFSHYNHFHLIQIVICWLSFLCPDYEMILGIVWQSTDVSITQYG